MEGETYRSGTVSRFSIHFRANIPTFFMYFFQDERLEFDGCLGQTASL